jgi:class 3 adenylate cyclase/CHAT domain-containing protein/tetratricopeptide (TPR) repeat protein
MTDQDNNNQGQDQKEKLSEAPAPEPKLEKPMAHSVEAILQERMRLENEQAALDKMLKDEFHKNIAVMFTDIKGSTSFFETYGDLEGRAMVQRHNSLMFPFVEKHGGKVIKTIGDAIMATFESPSAGVRAAIDMQKALHEHNAAQDQKHKRILVRIGLNYGAAVVEANDVFGDAVNVAARVESQADAEQILISDDLYKEVRSEDDILVRFFGDVTIKGKAEPVKIYRVVWSDEQLSAESEFKKAATRRTVDKRGFTVKGRVVELIASREGKNIKVSVFERARGEEKTVSSYDMVKVDDSVIKAQCEEVVNLLNRANKRGKITKEILKQMQAAGQIMFDHLLSAEAKEKILHTQAEHLLIRLDDHLVHIPWELLFDGKQFLCQRFSMGRIVATRQRIADVAERQISKPLRMLVVADPRNDLAAAKREGTHVRDELDKEHEFINVNLKAGDVPVTFLKAKIRDYDVIHYAGHADYDKTDPGNSGWLMADGKLTSNDIKAMTGNKPMPALVFANGCQSGQTDEWKLRADYEKDIFGLANAFLITGVQHYVGTFWDILDDPGHDFALAFYHEMIGGQSVGEAVRRARLSLVDKYGEETIVWASYMLYGDPTFSYLADTAEAEEGDTAQAPAPVAGQPQTIYMVAPGQQAIFRGADSAAMPRTGGISKTYLGIAAAVILLLAVIAGIYFKSSGGTVVIPGDAAAAGYMKIEKGDLQGALASFGSLAEKSETKAAGLEGLAAVYLAKNDLVAAEQNAREAIKTNPQTIGAHSVLGQIAYNRGDYAAAIAEFQAATQGTGKDSLKKDAFARLAMAFNSQGLAASQSGNGAAAVSSYEAAVKADPKDAQANINLGQTYLAQGNPAKAQEAFQRAATAAPNDSVASTLLAQAVSMMALSQDTAKQAEVNALVKDLAAAYKSGRIPVPKGGGDEWTSKQLTVTFLDLTRKGKMAMEGEDDFIKIALAQALRDSGRVEVVEREKIDRILQELNLAASELTNEDTRLRLGKLFGARLIGTGSYVRFGDETQVNIRLIETETSIAQVAIAEVFKGQKSPGDIAKALADMLLAKIREAYPIQAKVKQVNGETVKLNIGAKAGIVKGMKFAILDADQIKIGTLEVLEVGPDVAVAKVVEAPPKLAPEMKVREIVQ